MKKRSVKDIICHMVASTQLQAWDAVLGTASGGRERNTHSSQWIFGQKKKEVVIWDYLETDV